ncbi:MAG: hypothetical protein KBE77_07985 [Aliarcobacter sp.]|nr:hypothetical protein [Aliarcobacter sp.]
MKKIIYFLLLSLISLYAFNSNIQASYAIGIFDEYGNGENIQHKKTTDNDYNGTCYSKIVIFGNYFNSNIQVKIGESTGHLENSISIYNNKKIKIGEELTFKHFNVKKGYFEVKIDNKIYDSKVFIK